MRTYHADPPARADPEGSPILRTLCNWAAALAATALIRFGAWGFPLPEEARQFTAIGTHYADVPNPFDPASTDEATLDADLTAPHLFCHINFASFKVFAENLINTYADWNMEINSPSQPEPNARYPDQEGKDLDVGTLSDSMSIQGDVLPPLSPKTPRASALDTDLQEPPLGPTTSPEVPEKPAPKRNKPSTPTRISAGSRRNVIASQVAKESEDQATARRESKAKMVKLSHQDLFGDA
ncbi:hypothetical protein BOTBODRAFT_181767 [Botryobasidium botryosum FD-172 SS1]|uniref:Uncharacterized protein n=1 Tax=Botryobasidium botryosum (strain FD-172 SS1) TaxID=930990 RepID=A0A067LT77_BOTB1|nr:hypothetical protein BOTBODRAFT_181767 [Botryobasidium botryosum FD-172 SS1]